MGVRDNTNFPGSPKLAFFLERAAGMNEMVEKHLAAPSICRNGKERGQQPTKSPVIICGKHAPCTWLICANGRISKYQLFSNALP